MTTAVRNFSGRPLTHVKNRGSFPALSLGLEFKSEKAFFVVAGEIWDGKG